MGTFIAGLTTVQPKTLESLAQSEKVGLPEAPIAKWLSVKLTVPA
jgi:hypothetical protein